MNEEVIMEKAFAYWSECGRTLGLHDSINVPIVRRLKLRDYNAPQEYSMKMATVPVRRILAYAAAQVAQMHEEKKYAETEELRQIEISGRYRHALYRVGIPTETLNKIRDGARPDLEGHKL